MSFVHAGTHKTFQLTAARRRLERAGRAAAARKTVSTHSRPKAAGKVTVMARVTAMVSTHSRPKAAG